MPKTNNQNLGRPKGLTDSSMLLARRLYDSGLGYATVAKAVVERGSDEPSRYTVRRAVRWLAPYDYQPSDSG